MNFMHPILQIYFYLWNVQQMYKSKGLGSSQLFKANVRTESDHIVVNMLLHVLEVWGSRPWDQFSSARPFMKSRVFWNITLCNLFKHKPVYCQWTECVLVAFVLLVLEVWGSSPVEQFSWVTFYEESCLLEYNAIWCMGQLSKDQMTSYPRRQDSLQPL